MFYSINFQARHLEYDTEVYKGLHLPFLPQYSWKMIDTDKEECGERLAEKTQKIQKTIGKKSVK